MKTSSRALVIALLSISAASAEERPAAKAPAATPCSPARLAVPAPSGVPMPTTDPAGWKRIFADDFTTPVEVGSFPGPAFQDRWGLYRDGWKDTAGKRGANSRYFPSKVVSVREGMLNLDVHTEDGTTLAATLLPKIESGSNRLYGRYAVRFRADPVAGYKTAWLLWPQSGVWPRDGEIDFPEGNLTGTISAFMHRQDGKAGGDQDGYKSKATYQEWHTAVLEWLPERVSFILDGKTLGTSTNRIPSTPMHYVLQNERSLDGRPAPPEARGNIQVDWIVIYEPH